jgi:predicted site-specific integrase-resolvase
MYQTKYVSGKQASEILGVHQRTLYNWEKRGIIETIRTDGGKRLYNILKYLNEHTTQKNKLKICYVRVSSNGQKEDLKRQEEYMRKKYPNHTIIKDIGSGINMNRKGLNKIIDYAINGRIKELVVAYRDRLSKFGYSLIERLITKYSNGKITILNKKIIKTPHEEIVEDVLQIMNVFVAKMNGLRKYKLK